MCVINIERGEFKIMKKVIFYVIVSMYSNTITDPSYIDERY